MTKGRTWSALCRFWNGNRPLFLRGEEYFSVGAVQRLRAADDKVSAKVEGSETYQVELRDDDGELACGCFPPEAPME